MSHEHTEDLIRRRYRDVFGAAISPDYATWLGNGGAAALGYRRAHGEALFLERYLDEPVEDLVSRVLGRPVARAAIVEIGNFAAGNALAMMALWGAAANDLGTASEVAVATLTGPIRSMFTRIGLPFTVLAPAEADRIEAKSVESWGSYYAADPQVCMGLIAPGQRAISRFLARRVRSEAA